MWLKAWFASLTLNGPFMNRKNEVDHLHKYSQETARNGDKRGGFCAGIVDLSFRAGRLSSKQSPQRPSPKSVHQLG